MLIKLILPKKYDISSSVKWCYKIFILEDVGTMDINVLKNQMMEKLESILDNAVFLIYKKSLG